MLFLRIAIFLSVIASLIATMVGATMEAKAMFGFCGSGVVGLLWALLFRYVPLGDLEHLKKNINEAQRLVDESSFWAPRRKLYGLQPRSGNDSLDILEIVISLPFVGLCLAISIMLGIDPDFLSYVLDLQQPRPPEPKSLLLYVAFQSFLSAAFLGLFSRLLARVVPQKWNDNGDATNQSG